MVTWSDSDTRPNKILFAEPSPSRPSGGLSEAATNECEKDRKWRMALSDNPLKGKAACPEEGKNQAAWDPSLLTADTLGDSSQYLYPSSDSVQPCLFHQGHKVNDKGMRGSSKNALWKFSKSKCADHVSMQTKLQFLVFRFLGRHTLTSPLERLGQGIYYICMRCLKTCRRHAGYHQSSLGGSSGNFF